MGFDINIRVEVQNLKKLDLIPYQMQKVRSRSDTPFKF